MFQGMTLVGPKIFSTDLLNRFFNDYVVRLDSAEKPTVNEVFTFLELLITYLRHNSQLLDKVDARQLMSLSFDKYLDDVTMNLMFSQIAGLYWMCANFQYWEQSNLKSLENRAIDLMRKEVEIQNKLEQEYEADVPEGLQTMRQADVESVLRYYEEEIVPIPNYELMKLLTSVLVMDKPEKDRKWFHF